MKDEETFLRRCFGPVAAVVAVCLSCLAAGCGSAGDDGELCTAGEYVEGGCVNSGCLVQVAGHCTDSFAATPPDAVDWAFERDKCGWMGGTWGQCPDDRRIMDIRITDGSGTHIRHYYVGTYCSAAEVEYYIASEFGDSGNIPVTVMRDDGMVCEGAPVQDAIACEYSSGHKACLELTGDIQQARADSFDLHCRQVLDGDVAAACPTDGAVGYCEYPGPGDTAPACPIQRDFYYNDVSPDFGEENCALLSGATWHLTSAE